jgi:thiopeptide-type bacteriocin biosynthesis protein
MDGDKRLPIDFENVLSVRGFLRLLHKGSGIYIEEMLPDVNELCVRSKEGRFQHDMIVPVISVRLGKECQDSASLTSTHTSQVPLRRRVFAPGSSWIYVKVYGSSYLLERILLQHIWPFVQSPEAAKYVSRWFFLRYADPETHLRLRLLVPSKQGHLAVSERLAILGRTLLDQGFSWRIQLDTYSREVERYGGYPAIEFSEMIFQADSQAVLQLLRSIEEDSGMVHRCRLAILGTHSLLDDFGLDQASRLHLMTSLRDGYRGEFGAHRADRHAIGRTFRTNHETFMNLLARDWRQEVPALSARSDAIKTIIARLRVALGTDRATFLLQNSIDSYIHMFLNRLLRTSPRQHELVFYDFMHRIYSSMFARAQSRSAHA